MIPYASGSGQSLTNLILNWWCSFVLVKCNNQQSHLVMLAGKVTMVISFVSFEFSCINLLLFIFGIHVFTDDG